MEVYEAIKKRRTIRRFKQDPISKDVLTKLVNAARICPSSGNLQLLRYIVVANPQLVKQVFACTQWAGYIAPAGNPPEGEEPVAYIVVLIDTEIVSDPKRGLQDSGAAIENIILAAVGEGIGSCWIGAHKKKDIREVLDIPERFVIETLVALGYPNEEPLMIEMTDSIKYFKDETGQLHVPKRKLEDIMEIRE